MLSIKDLVDEYIVVDSSTDNTPEIIKQVAREHGLNVKIYRIPWDDLVKARNIALKESSYKWILHWDGDFIATDNMLSFIEDFVTSLGGLVATTTSGFIPLIYSNDCRPKTLSHLLNLFGRDMINSSSEQVLETNDFLVNSTM